MTQVSLKEVIDQAFALAEAAEAGHPVVVKVLQIANGLVDGILPQLVPQLQARGFKIETPQPAGRKP